MRETQGYKEVFKPYLIAKRDQSFPDPSQFTKDEEFIYAAKVASVFKKVCAEILLWVDAQAETAEQLEEKKKNTQPDPFAIGS